jgi:hypothetical protein
VSSDGSVNSSACYALRYLRPSSCIYKVAIFKFVTLYWTKIHIRNARHIGGNRELVEYISVRKLIENEKVSNLPLVGGERERRPSKWT